MLRELGRLERTLFTLDWIDDPDPRRGTGQELNKGESRNSLARAVFIHRLGEIRARTYENQQHRASGLNLVVSAIVLWNTRYLERAVEVPRRAENAPDVLLAHLSPLGREHVNLTGDYVWGAEKSVSENIDPRTGGCEFSDWRESGRQTTIRVTSSHAKAKPVARALEAVAAFLRGSTESAEQLARPQTWRASFPAPSRPSSTAD